MKEKIDFVVLWVDGNDETWKKEKNMYLKNKEDIAASASRYRDWDNLQYWFRGVEKYATWVNKIYFVTCGHIPIWLNTENEKLVIVKHEEYIKKENLPTFNSNVIELCMNKIPNLSEHFVAFNDDMFILKNTTPDDFFYKGLPRDQFVENTIISFGKRSQIVHANLNNMDIINRNFKKRRVIKNNFLKVFNHRYGARNLRTLFLTPWYAFCGFHNYHMPVSYCKSTFDKVWDSNEKKYLEEASTHKFRTYEDITHWVMRYWQLCEGKFYPRSNHFGKYYNVSKDNRQIIKHILKQKTKAICINDTNDDIDFEKSKKEINEAFEKILPKKSSFEK